MAAKRPGPKLHFSTKNRMLGWKRMKDDKRRLLFGGCPAEFERFCDARDAIGVVTIHDAIRKLVDKFLDGGEVIDAQI